MENFQIYRRVLRCTPNEGIVQIDEAHLFEIIRDCLRKVMSCNDKRLNLNRCNSALALCRRMRSKEGEEMMRLIMARYGLAD